MLLFAAAEARAESGDIAIGSASAMASPGVMLSSASLSDPLQIGQSSNPSVSFGRAQDIVGIPVDIRAKRSGGDAAGRSLGQRGLAVMPGRLPLVSGAMTSRFGLRRHPIFGDLRAHRGVDLAAPVGTPVYASAAGTIGSAGWSGGYGLLVAIDHSGGMETRYGHLSRIAVSGGQYVTAGSLIGYVGTTGDSTGPHLHYEVRINGQAVDPLRR